MTKVKKKVLIALSGGIDSAVSAWLLQKQGYEVEAAFMKNWSSTKGLKVESCPWLQDRQEALRVAAFLRIPLHTLDFEKQYEQNVLNYFFTEYQAGRTPNPDVMCNKEIKFKLLYKWAMQNGFDYLATGHYARVVEITSNELQVTKRGDPHSLLVTNHFQLLRSADEFKDQTYFIYNIKQEQLPHILFPVGGYKKDQVKKLAEKIGLPNAGRKESMGLCFVGKIRLKEFLEQKVKPPKGKIVDMDGKIIGEHQGLSFYTIGQRQGIGIGAKGPYYVVRKVLSTNTLVVTDDPSDKQLLTKVVELSNVHWITKPSVLPAVLLGRVRHQGELVSVKIEKGDVGYEAVFAKPQKAVASGQSLVLYKGKVCVGGAIIA